MTPAQASSREIVAEMTDAFDDFAAVINVPSISALLDHRDPGTAAARSNASRS